MFKGETLRSILLNAYGWWTVATIALYVGFALIAAGLVLAFLSLLGFRRTSWPSGFGTRDRLILAVGPGGRRFGRPRGPS